MSIKNYKHTVRFYFLSTIVTWTFWFIAAYLSHITPSSNIYAISGGLLALLGLVSPMIKKTGGNPCFFVQNFMIGAKGLLPSSHLLQSYTNFVPC